MRNRQKSWSATFFLFANIRTKNKSIEAIACFSTCEPKEIEYTRNCPICDEKFFCELRESDTSEQETNVNLDEQVNEHIREIHEEKKAKKEENDLSEKAQNKSASSDKQKSEQNNSSISSKTNESKIPLPLIINWFFVFWLVFY